MFGVPTLVVRRQWKKDGKIEGGREGAISEGNERLCSQHKAQGSRLKGRGRRRAARGAQAHAVGCTRFPGAVELRVAVVVVLYRRWYRTVLSTCTVGAVLVGTDCWDTDYQRW